MQLGLKRQYPWQLRWYNPQRIGPQYHPSADRRANRRADCCANSNTRCTNRNAHSGNNPGANRRASWDGYTSSEREFDSQIYRGAVKRWFEYREC